MADTVKVMRGAIAVVCTLAAVAVAAGESLVDPTRPPDVLNQGATVSVGDGGNRLLLIVHSNKGKPGAIINGEYVLLGGRIGEARLIKISEDSVTLKTPEGTEILKLVPGVEKTYPAVADKEAAKIMPKKRNKGKKSESQALFHGSPD